MLEKVYHVSPIKCKSSIFLLLIGIVSISAQNPSNRFFSSGSEIVVDVLPGNDIYYSHVCDKGINIYNLAEVFQINAEELLRENKIDPKKPNYQGKIVKIPLQKGKLVTNQNFKADIHPHIKVNYKVKKGDNLFRIAKEYFDTDVTSLVIINKKKSNEVKIGEQIQVGWILLNSTIDQKPKSPNKIKKTTDTNEQLVSKLPSSPLKVLPADNRDDVKIVKYYLSDVIGFYDRAAGNSKSYFVLHNEAQPGTIMDVYNPMLKKHIKAKVLGKIPEGTYSEDVEIIISNAVAKDLGILDSRFKVNIKYEE